MNWQAMALTAELASLASLILMLVGIPLALWLAYSRRSWKFLAESVVALPIVLPPTVMGFYLLFAFGSDSEFGRWYQHITGSTLAFTFKGLVIASVLYSLPFAINPMVAGFRSVDQKLVAAARTLGASKFKVYSQVVLPLAWPSVVTGLVLSFAHSVGEFGVLQDVKPARRMLTSFLRFRTALAAPEVIRRRPALNAEAEETHSTWQPGVVKTRSLYGCGK